MGRNSDGQQRLPAELSRVNLNAAGIDVGASSHFVAAPADRSDQPVREFAAYTAELYRLADWLAECGVENVAMESTRLDEIKNFPFEVQIGPVDPQLSTCEPMCTTGPVPNCAIPSAPRVVVVGSIGQRSNSAFHRPRHQSEFHECESHASSGPMSRALAPSAAGSVASRSRTTSSGGGAASCKRATSASIRSS